ncbi:MAG TPA: ABC transporter permease [Terriglobia bacterium]|nr:ABC transporter permease [Terriglobia bacterium]
MTTLIHDLKYAVRMLTKNPGFTLVAALTLALGIGASTTVYSWIELVLLRPLPGVEKPEELVAFENFAPNGTFLTTSYLDYRDYRDHLTSLAGLAATQIEPLSIGSQDHARQVWGEMVTGNYFSVLGVKPVLGRVFSPEEDSYKPNGFPIAVISSRLWRTYFNADPSIAGKMIRVNQHELTIVGVAPPDFRGTISGLAFDVWIPFMMHPEIQGVDDWMLRDRQTRQLICVARLKPGVTLTQARSEISALALRMSVANVPEDVGVSATVLPIWQGHAGAQSLLLKPLEILMAVCVVVLLIVCANVANLLLARFSARQKEFSVRLALGAGRIRLARQVLTESLVLAATGAAGGVTLAAWMGGALQYMFPPSHFPVALDVRVNGRVLLFTVLACIATALLAGIVPAMQVARTNLNERLKEGGRSDSASGRSHRLRALLVVSELSMAIVALVCAGLLVRSFEAARTINPQFDPDHVLMSRFFISTSGYNLEQRKEFCERLAQKLESEPSVTDVAYSDVEPLGILSGWWESLEVQGYVPGAGENMKIYRSVVSPGYFKLMRIPLLEGRDFTPQDDEKKMPVMVVNQTFVKRFFGGGDPIGRKVHGWGAWFTVVGEVKDSKYNNLTEAQLPYIYVHFRQVYRADMGLAYYIRTNTDPSGATATMRSDVRATDPNVAIIDVIPLAQHVVDTLYAEKVAADLLSALGGLALLLAAVGLYSVVAYSVTQRTHEIGIRMALGAESRDVLRLVVGQGLSLTLIGITVGLVAALGSGRLLASFLYGTTTTDPITFLAASILLAGVALMASLIPALRATKVEPMEALRYE